MVKSITTAISYLLFNITTIVFFTGNSWPLNYHFTFILLTVMLLCLLPLIFSLSKSVETKKL